MREMIKRPVLDHGYLGLVDSWGSDEGIIEAARMSTNKGFLGWGTPEKEGDEKLLRYLYEHKHHTPFEMAGLTLEIQAPIFVFREWQRHRTQSFNELSARYVKMPNENYIPGLERLLKTFVENAKNKQASSVDGAVVLTPAGAETWRKEIEVTYTHLEELYQHGLKIGISKELARVIVPVGRYSRMRASANLRNWLGFLTLRMDPAAQWEIRMYANEVGNIIAEKFPRTWELFQDGRAKKT